MGKYDEMKISIEEKVGEIFAICAGFFLIIASCIMFANMASRTAFNFNIRVVYEVCQLAGAGVASFAVPYATIKAAHTEMDIITSHLNARVRNFLGGIAGIITIAVMLFTVYMLVTYAYQRTLTFETTTTNHLPLWCFRWLYAFGMFCTMLVAVIEMIDSFRLAMGKQVFRNRAEYEEYLAAQEEKQVETAATEKIEGGEKNE